MLSIVWGLSLAGDEMRMFRYNEVLRRLVVCCGKRRMPCCGREVKTGCLVALLTVPRLSLTKRTERQREMCHICPNYVRCSWPHLPRLCQMFLVTSALNLSLSHTTVHFAV